MDEFMAIFIIIISILVALFLMTQVKSFKEIGISFLLISLALYINSYLY